MQNFSPLALKLREEIEGYIRTYCKNAKFLSTPRRTKSVLKIFTELPLEKSKRGIVREVTIWK